MGIRDEAKQKMQGSIDHFIEDLKQIRTGRANPAILDNVVVEVYGTEMRIKELGNVTAPEPRVLLITPFDANNASAIGKGVEKANLGINPIVDGNQVRLMIPSMDEALRKEMVKQVHKKREECKVGIRNVRRELNEKVRKMKSDGDMPEDQMKRSEKDIQDETDAFCKKADEISAGKEKEVLTV